MKKLLTLIPLATTLALLLAWPGQSQTGHYISLSWTAVATPVVGYNLYRGTTTGGPYTKLNTSILTGLTYNDTTGTGGTKYFYVATAVDSAGVESLQSNEVSGTFLGAPAAPVMALPVVH